MGLYCNRSTTTTAAAVLLLLFLVFGFPHRVKSLSSIFELQLVSLHLDARDGCCSSSSGCAADCPVFLHFCMKQFQNVVDMTSPCFFHQSQTPRLNTTSIPGEYDVRSIEPIAIKIPYTWPGKFSLVVGAWRREEKTSPTQVSVFVAPRYLDVSPDWTNDRIHASEPSSPNRRILDLRYRIICKEFYYGRKCEKLCRPRNDSFGHYTCDQNGDPVCMRGWKNAVNATTAEANTTLGLYCQTAICDTECLHGKCIKPDRCECSPGWTGQFCDTCLYPNCKHGRCQANYQCICEEGWGGQLCDQDLNYCTNHKPCKHGGTCTNTGQGSFTCSCSDEYMGETCSTAKNPCKDNPCKNGATCTNLKDGEYSCSCPPDYFGEQCETWAHICNEYSCINGGTCIPNPNGFACSCMPGYTGDFCEELDFRNCQVHPCFNGGTCTLSSTGPQCSCPSGVSGIRCETAHTCLSDTCRNGGTCVRGPRGNLTCRCPPGYSGSLCHLNPCAANPCRDPGARCTNLADGGHRCSHCHSAPCLNGGACLEDDKSGYRCDCPEGFRGHHCQMTSVVNASHHVSSKLDGNAPEANVADICLWVGVPLALAAVVCLVACAAVCHRRRRKRKRRAEEAKQKQLSYKQKCDMPTKIVNDLDDVRPPKVLNTTQQANNVAIVSPQRTMLFNNKMENVLSTGASVSHSSQDSSRRSSGIYVIEDHLKSCVESKPDFQKDILATQV